MFLTPRPVPARLGPVIAGSAVIALGLPVFLAAGWPLSGWALAAVLWVAGQLLAAGLTLLPLGTGNVAAAGVRGIGQTFRVIAVGVPLVAVTVGDEGVGIAAALLYALAFTLELAVGLLLYFGEEAKA